mmetsp:Transcript_25192/g.31037  ORF Transcript_25192/g.31037 Transcript_25192/m.31037 type:complete len:102 (+) Transcript_25192:20-325(+)
MIDDLDIHIFVLMQNSRKKKIELFCDFFCFGNLGTRSLDEKKGEAKVIEKKVLFISLIRLEILISILFFFRLDLFSYVFFNEGDEDILSFTNVGAWKMNCC